MNDELNKPKNPAGEPGDESGDLPDMHHIVDETDALIRDMNDQVDRLRAERDEARAAHKLALADFQNFQRRAATNERDAKEQGIRNVLHAVLPVLDHFDMALLSDPEKVSAKQVMDGVTLIKSELIRALSLHGVQLIAPSRDDAFDPQRHEAIMNRAEDGVQPGHVVVTLRPGFMLNDRLVRPAQVAVAPQSE